MKVLMPDVKTPAKNILAYLDSIKIKIMFVIIKI